MTPKQKKLAELLRVENLSEITVGQVWDGEKYVGPPEAELEVMEYVRWRLRFRKNGSGLDLSAPLGQRRARLSWESNWLTVADVKKLWRTFRERIGRRNAVRDQMLLSLMYRTGMRVSEVSALNVEDLVEDEYLAVRKAVLVYGKGGKFRKIPLVPLVRADLKKFLAWKKKNRESVELSAPLFCSGLGNRMSVRQMEATVENWANLAGLQRITAHGLRHSFGTHLAHGSPKGLLVAQRVMGHSSLMTTQKYLHLSPDDYGDAMDTLT